MKTTFLVVIVIPIVLPFLVYLFSKIQMLAWLKMIDAEIKLDVATKIEEKRKREESCNGKEEKRI